MERELLLGLESIHLGVRVALLYTMVVLLQSRMNSAILKVIALDVELDNRLGLDGGIQLDLGILYLLGIPDGLCGLTSATETPVDQDSATACPIPIIICRDGQVQASVKDYHEHKGEGKIAYLLAGETSLAE